MSDFKWTPEFEKKYWEKFAPSYYRDVLKKKWEVFHTSRLLPASLVLGLMSHAYALDIGGGAYGGALSFLSGSWVKVLVDPLAEYFVERGTLPKDIVPVIGTVTDLRSLPSSIFDVVFCWELFEHLDDESQVEKALCEVETIMKTGAFLFVHHLVRIAPQVGHPFFASIGDFHARLGRFELLWQRPARHELYAIYRKG